MALKPGQEKCIHTLDRSLVVAAGAGSGKTFTLTKRIAHALESGFIDDIGEVLAITFTRKAAGELKSRIKAELGSRGMVDQALKVDEAWISTIHGMCARILRTHAVELGINPQFTVIEGADEYALMQRAIETVLVRKREAGSPEVDALFDEYAPRSQGFGASSVEAMVGRIVELACSVEGRFDAIVLPDAEGAPDVGMALARVLGLMEHLIESARVEKESPSRDDWIVATEDACARIGERLAQGALDARDALGLIAGLTLGKKFGSKDYKAHIDDARLEISRIAVELRLSIAQEHLATLVSLACEVAQVLDESKAEAGMLDNDDLLVLAYRALKEHPDIAVRYTDRFKLIMVDEFQDTDQMQVDMIKLLAGEGACRLCVVGDAQQSIYRFRGADVSVYRRHVAEVAARDDESVIELPDSFRSHPDILAFVDCIFGSKDMFADEYMGLDAGRDEQSVACPYADGQPRIVVQETSAPWQGVSSAQVVERAAARVAERFASLRDAGHSAGEMVVLLGRMANAETYAKALRAVHMPCVVAGGSVFSRAPEVGIVASLVRCLANPHETQALYQVLSSDLFDIEATDLVHLATSYDADGIPRKRTLDTGLAFCAHELSDAAGARSDISAKLENAVRVISGAQVAARASVAHAVEAVLLGSGWIARMEKQGAEGQARAANAYKALRMIGRIERESGAGPAQVSHRFEQELLASKEAPGALSTSEGDFVRIMTVHASKGLEFPIVAVADLGDGRPRSSKLLASCIDGKVFLSLDAGRTAGDLEGAAKVDGDALRAVYGNEVGEGLSEDALACIVRTARTPIRLRAAIACYDALGEAEESKRLLYVAFTRAKEALVVSMRGRRTKGNPNAIPNGVFSGVVAGLDETGCGFGEGIASYGFGGIQPAFVEHVALESQGQSPECNGRDSATAQEKAHGGSDLETAAVQVGSNASEPFEIPVASGQSAQPMFVAPVKLSHRGVFSYSSVAEHSHEGDLLDCLAEAFAIGCDGVPDNASGDSEPTEQPAGSLPWPFEDADAGVWEDALYRGDSDKATALGTAFHRLAQLACLNRENQGGRLVQPDGERIEALARACCLDSDARLRLQEALERWFASDIARFMEGLGTLRAEVPFFVRIDRDDLDSKWTPAYLEGEIDLLGVSADGTAAYVVDYKTGGHADEGAATLERKHVLQASCYAYALVRQGFERVEACFVRVEQSSCDVPGQPQCVRYRFGADDAGALENAIAACLKLL